MSNSSHGPPLHRFLHKWGWNFLSRVYFISAPFSQKFCQFVSLMRRIRISAPLYTLRKELCFGMPFSFVCFPKFYKSGRACDPEMLFARSEFYKSQTSGLCYLSKTEILNCPFVSGQQAQHKV